MQPHRSPACVRARTRAGSAIAAALSAPVTALAAGVDAPLEVGKQVDTALHSVLLVAGVLVVLLRHDTRIEFSAAGQKS